jgi:hypothetical protein
MKAAVRIPLALTIVCGFGAIAAGLSIENALGADHAYVYCDNGLRCIRAPCPSRSARDLTTGQTYRGIHLDLQGLSPEDRKRSDLGDALYYGTLVLGGEILSMPPAPDGRPAGTILLVRHIVRPSIKAERSHCSSSQ